MIIKKLKERYKIGLGSDLLGAVGQISFVLYILLVRNDVPQLSFVEGALLGLSITGNLAWLIQIRKRGGN